MSQIDDLIEQYCPNGVEYKSLGELGKFMRGGGPQKKHLLSSGKPCIHYGQIYTRYGLYTGETLSFVAPEVFDSSRKASAGDVIIADTSENDEDLAKSVAWVGNEEVAVSNHTLIYSSPLNPKYVSYFLSSHSFQKQKRRHITGVKVRSISENGMSKIKIPVPPLEVQDEIVRILDSFTKLEAELEAELEARRKQYEYYRDSLLSLEKLNNQLEYAIKIIPLGNICKIARGASPRPIRSFLSQDSFDSVPWIKIGDIDPAGKYVTKTSQYIKPSGVEKSREVFPGDFLLSNSMSFGRPYISKIYGCIHDGWLKLSDFEKTFLPDYLYHLLRSSQVQLQFQASVGSGTVSNLNSLAVSKVMVPVPPLVEQERIVAILDKFDALVNDLSSGLPAEITARRKQYEYYRDRLLTFTPAK
ncbi:MAG: restriction endonuclease subunit S [Varibaculum cambriense]|uniref:restriction endonuclease subunit S n=1 Tax=Varibaculum cambriense TaxID=184870 RepID=UPI002557BD34|nr:restriction endonuclease subunit S [Varibaculum cambriense]MDK8274508.1 restriction endonuclease subunit S [Varibaculum cambriense]MDU5269232.1 restriction endonuclease subunit S [Varibaculum cambriense]MDU5308261.1 restriction endonuclease subunit S [Varibaculum cambriense]